MCHALGSGSRAQGRSELARRQRRPLSRRAPLLGSWDSAGARQTHRAPPDRVQATWPDDRIGWPPCRRARAPPLGTLGTSAPESKKRPPHADSRHQHMPRNPSAGPRTHCARLRRGGAPAAICRGQQVRPAPIRAWLHCAPLPGHAQLQAARLATRRRRCTVSSTAAPLMERDARTPPADPACRALRHNEGRPRHPLPLHPRPHQGRWVGAAWRAAGGACPGAHPAAGASLSPPALGAAAWRCGCQPRGACMLQGGGFSPSRRDFVAAGIGSLIGGGAMFFYDTCGCHRRAWRQGVRLWQLGGTRPWGRACQAWTAAAAAERDLGAQQPAAAAASSSSSSSSSSQQQQQQPAAAAA